MEENNLLTPWIEHLKNAACWRATTKETLEEQLMQIGAKKFVQYENVLIGANEHDILLGIGIDTWGNFKIWNNRFIALIEEK